MILSSSFQGKLSVRFPPISNPKHAHGFLVLIEESAVVADTEAELWRVETVSAFDAAGAGFGEAFNGLFDAAGDTSSRAAKSSKAVPVHATSIIPARAFALLQARGKPLPPFCFCQSRASGRPN